MKKIYPKQWLEIHPYTTIDEVDRYYCRIANQLTKILYAYDPLPGNFLVDNEIYEETATFLAAWFEDVISQTGIWQTFTAECEKRYGSRLPFFELDSNYFYDEINLEDIRFILWHCFQNWQLEEVIYNPEALEYKQLAKEIFALLDKKYETAPENVRLREFFDFSQLTENDFFEYRNKVEWFYFNCYINTGTQHTYLKELKKVLKENQQREDIKENEINVKTYSLKVGFFLLVRTPLLGITAPEFLKLIQEHKQADSHAPYMNIEGIKETEYTVESESDTFYVFRNATGNQTLYKVLKKSLVLDSDYLIPGETLVSSKLFKYGEYWYHNGAMTRYKVADLQEMREKIKELEDLASKNLQKRIYDLFMKATEGKHFVFFKDEGEVTQFVEQKLKVKYNKSDALFSNSSDGSDTPITVTATPELGLYLIKGIYEYIASPENPYYDQKVAEENAILVLTNQESITYEIICDLIDHGYLKDAGFYNTLGAERGRELVRKNAQFITDYFFKRCREKDCHL